VTAERHDEMDQLQTEVAELKELVRRLVGEQSARGAGGERHEGSRLLSRGALVKGVAAGAAGLAAAGMSGVFNGTNALAFSESDATTFVAEGNGGTSSTPAGTGFQTATANKIDSAYYSTGAFLVGSKYGVYASSASGVALHGSTKANDAVQGTTAATNQSGVAGFNTSGANGYGTYGQGQTGVFGRSLSAGVGVLGVLNDSAPPAIPAGGAAIQGDGGTGGLGGYFSSGGTAIRATGTGIGVDASSSSIGVQAYGSTKGIYATTNAFPDGNGQIAIHGDVNGSLDLGGGAYAIGVLGSNSDGGGGGAGVQGTHAGNGWGGYFTGTAGGGAYGGTGSTAANVQGLHGEITTTTPAAGSAGVLGQNDGTNANGYGVQGTHAGGGWGGYFSSANGHGAYGSTASTTSGASGVLGEVTSTSPGTGSVGVFGKNDGTNANGYGVRGYHAGGGYGGYFTSVSGTGAYASGTTVGIRGAGGNGRGAVLSGATAQLSLSPASASHPASGQRGDFFVDTSGHLWFCRGGTTWAQLA